MDKVTGRMSLTRYGHEMSPRLNVLYQLLLESLPLDEPESNDDDESHELLKLDPESYDDE